jgi:hypothetical protein
LAQTLERAQLLNDPSEEDKLARKTPKDEKQDECMQLLKKSPCRLVK